MPHRVAAGRWWLIPPLLAVAWGLNWPAVKIMLSALPPFTMRVWGLGAAGLLMLGVALLQRKSLVPPRHGWLGMFVSGLLSVAAFNLFTTFAQLNTTTSRAAVLTYTMPVMMVLMAWLLLGEQLTRRTLAAMALGAAGIALLAWPTLSAYAWPVPGAQHSLLGLVMPLGAALSWGLGTIVAKRWALVGDKWVNVGWQLVLGAAVASLGMFATGEALPQAVPQRVWVALAYHVVFGTAIGYVVWFVLLERVSATVSSLTTLAVPVVGVLTAMLLVGDRPAALDWLGFAAVLCSAGVVMLPQRRTAVPELPPTPSQDLKQP